MKQMLQKIQRKLAYLYYDWKLNPLKRKIFDPKTYLQKLAKSPKKPFFTKPIFLLHYDDISIMNSRYGYADFGGDTNGKLWKLFSSFLGSYPFLKHTLFFIPNPRFQSFFSSSLLSRDLFNIEKNSKHPLIATLKIMAEKEVIEVAQHGYSHVSTVYKNYYPAFEFEFLKSLEASEKIIKGFQALSPHFKIHGFKPPAWGIGQLSGSYYLKEVLKNVSLFQYVSLSSPTNGLNYAENLASHLYPTSLGSIINIPQNISIYWDWDFIRQVIDLLIEKNAIINVQLHFTLSRKEIVDGISEENLQKLARIVEYIPKENVEYLLSKDVLQKYSKDYLSSSLSKY